MPLKLSVVNWRNTSFFLLVHLIALLAFVPWFFSWAGVALCAVGIFVFGTVGLSVGYHRLFTHRGFTCSPWLERVIAVLGCCCGEEAPAFWVAVHRRHHHHSDDVHDPHSPLSGFFWAHVGWLLVTDPELNRYRVMDRYARELRRDPFHARLIQHDTWIIFFFLSWAVFFVSGLGTGLLLGWSWNDTIQFAWSLLIWGGALRTVIVWHQTWFVNSASHIWGYRNYETKDTSRNNIWAGIFCNGDGWHNNHHADPNSAMHGHRWWEIDLSWTVIRSLAIVGLARDVVLPSSTTVRPMTSVEKA